MKRGLLVDRSVFQRALILLAAGVSGLAGLLVAHGLPASPANDRLAQILEMLAVSLFLIELVLAWFQRVSARAFLRQRWPALVLSLLLLLELVAVQVLGARLLAGQTFGWLRPTSLTQIFLVVLQLHITALILVNLPRLHGRFAALRIRPGLAFLLVFATAIVGGAGLLSLPEATPAGDPIGPVDALFTATSAVCVTGLIVRDTASEFTRFGHVVILILMQLGGLGIMSLTAALALLLGRGIGVRENRLMREVFQVPMLQQVRPILRFILLWTLGTEALGTVALYSSLDGLVADPGDRLFCALFHAVSAFCNAGFSTFPDSLVGWSTRPAGVLSVAGLLILGGLGFVVALDLLRLAHASGRGLPRSAKPRLSLQTRVVLGWTVGLLIVGTVFLLGLEHGGALSEMGWRHGLLHAFFQAATCRTAGFNSLDLNALAPASLFLMILLMFVGAGPGSTAGGVKISTVAVVAAEIRAIAAGRRQARIGRRELDDQDRHRATVVLTAAALLAALGTLLLLITERSAFLATAFEAVSALGTVGLSLGLTPQLSGAGKIVVMLLMFVGRLGVLTFAYALVRPARDATVRLPRSGLMIG